MCHVDRDLLVWRRYEALVFATWGSTPGQAMDHPLERGPHLGLALAGEAGEVVEIIKKAHRRAPSAHLLNDRQLLSELGDVLWAITSIAIWRGHTLDEVRVSNEIKLAERHPALVAKVEP